MRKSQNPNPKSQRVRSTRRSRFGLGFGIWVLGFVLCARAASAQDFANLFWPIERPPRPLAARDVTFPPYEVRMLANGLQVIAVLHHEQPVVSMRLLVRAGSVQDPAGKIGVANLMASLLDQGIIDSTGVLEVVTFLESTFGIQVEDSELLPENLDSVERAPNVIASPVVEPSPGPPAARRADDTAQPPDFLPRGEVERRKCLEPDKREKLGPLALGRFGICRECPHDRDELLRDGEPGHHAGRAGAQLVDEERAAEAADRADLGATAAERLDRAARWG